MKNKKSIDVVFEQWEAHVLQVRRSDWTQISVGENLNWRVLSWLQSVEGVGNAFFITRVSKDSKTHFLSHECQRVRKRIFLSHECERVRKRIFLSHDTENLNFDPQKFKFELKFW